MSRSDTVVSTDYAHPYRPMAVRLFNTVGGLAGGTALEPDALMAMARKRTGLTDFGDPSFREPLGILCDSITREARLNALGRSIMRGRILSMLQTRLRIEALYAGPEGAAIEALSLARPIVIAGLQRTGTTLLHRLLASDPAARALWSWEALNPVPIGDEGRTGGERRRRQARVAERGLQFLAPDFFAIHPVQADAPEEEVLLLDHAFTSQAPEATLHVPTYASWLETQDLTPSYRFLARALKVLLWQRPGDYWVLKTPHHLEYIRELLSVFPDATIVQTHRDPQATMGSFCSMVAHGRGVFSDEVDAREVGTHWLRKVRRMLDRSLAVRDGGAAGRFVDVSYYDLTADPIAQIQRIYAHAGRTLTADAEARMREVVARDKQHRFGRHVYRNTDFGFSRATVEETFADYRARFAIRHERDEREQLAQPSGDRALGFQNPLAATVTGILDLWTRRGSLPPLPESVRLDGQTVLLTGATSGLGHAVAIDLCRRGARLLLPVRSRVDEIASEIERAAGVPAGRVEALRCDLEDLDDVARLADVLAGRGERVDVFIGNAGVMPVKARKTRQGFEAMFGLHYLANHLLSRLLLECGVIANDVFAANGRVGSTIPRIVFVASETHRGGTGLDLEHFGAFVDYGVTDGIAAYGRSKLALTTYAVELARRLTTPGGPSVSVHSLCPGPVDSRLARDAPAAIRVVLKPVMHTMFRAPAIAAEPVTYLAAAPELAGDSGWYMHLMRRKSASEAAIDAENGRRVWEAGEALLEPWLGRKRAG